MVMLIESICALMVFSAEINAEVKETCLFQIHKCSVWVCIWMQFVLLSRMQNRETKLNKPGAQRDHH